MTRATGVLPLPRLVAVSLGVDSEPSAPAYYFVAQYALCKVFRFLVSLGVVRILFQT
ncbi:MAG TPA: hypothetical protein VND43_01520 [Burkholderiales bacterium]|nr:hypothetical protein [Burkholderiales bacterium]